MKYINYKTALLNKGILYLGLSQAAIRSLKGSNVAENAKTSERERERDGARLKEREGADQIAAAPAWKNRTVPVSFLRA